MEKEVNSETVSEGSSEQNDGSLFLDGYVVSVRFEEHGKTYFFHTYNQSLCNGNEVIVETIRGIELGNVVLGSRPLTSEQQKMYLKSVLRIANEEDKKNHEANLVLARKAEILCQESIIRLKLDMHLVKVEYTLDSSKVIFMYVADTRVDFRELLKELASKLKCRIELRQIGTRDRSKTVGGIGICGLPLCCSTFLNEFDGISINMAKNQYLALNIQKLSGHCSKLICCLKYEDDLYTVSRRGLPKMGTKIPYEGQTYKITGVNVLSKQIKLENYDRLVVMLTIDEVLKIIQNEEKKNG